MNNSAIFIVPLGYLNVLKIYLYYDGPQIMSFVSSTGQKYFAMNVASEKTGDIWYFVPVSDKRLEEIECDQCSLHDAIVDSELGIIWEVKIQYKGNNHSARYLTSAELNRELIPDTDAFLEYQPKEDCVSAKEVSKAENIPNPLLLVTKPADDEAVALNRDIIDISLEPNGAHHHSIEAEHLGLILLRTQSLIKSHGISKINIKNHRQKKMYEDKFALNTIGFYAASFGVRLAAKHDAGLFKDVPAPISQTIDTIMQLLRRPSAETVDLIKTLDYRTLSRYRFFLKALKKSNSSVRVNWSSPNRCSRSAYLSLDDIASSLELLEKEETNMIGRLTLSGKLTMIDSDRNAFRFYDTDDQLYTGRISEQLRGKVFHVNCNVNIELEEMLEINPTTQEENISYTLIKVEYFDNSGV